MFDGRVFGPNRLCVSECYFSGLWLMELHGNAIDQNGLQCISNCSRVAIEYMFFSILIWSDLCMWKLIFDADCLAVLHLKVYWLWNYIWNDSIWLAMRMELDGNANSWCGILGMKLHCLCTLVELCNIAVCLLTNVLSKVRKFIAILEILDLADFLRNSFVVTVDSSNQPRPAINLSLWCLWYPWSSKIQRVL